MRQQNLDKIEANSSHDTITRISRERVKKLYKSPDTSRMICIEVPSLRLKYYVKTKKDAKKRIKMIEEKYPGREIKYDF